jgi:hypothetical protein
LGERSDTDGAMVRVLRALAAALVAAGGMDTATPWSHVAVDVPFLQPHLEASAAPVRGCAS